MRRLRSALVGLANSVDAEVRIAVVRLYLKQLDLTIIRSIPDVADQEMARQEDRQGLGLSRRHVEAKKPSP